MAHRKWILHVVEGNSTPQCICSHFNCTAELHSVACRMDSAHAIFYVHNPPMVQIMWFRVIWHTENEFYMLWNVIQHCNVFVVILVALPNCIRQHVECIRHMPYSMFMALLWLKGHDMAYRKWILHVVECNSTLQCICSHFSCTAELHSAHAIFYVHNPPMAQIL